MRPVATTEDSSTPMAPLLEIQHGGRAFVAVTSGPQPTLGTARSLIERPHQGRNALDLAHQEAALVDGVAADALQPAGVRPGGVPDLVRRQRRIVPGHLQVVDADVVDRAQLAVGDQVLGQAHGRHEAVVERAHRLAARRGRRVAHPPGIVDANGHRLLADHVLAVLQGGDARLGVDRVGPAIVEHVDPLVGDQFVPVGAVLLVAVAGGLALDQIAASCRTAPAAAASTPAAG